MRSEKGNSERSELAVFPRSQRPPDHFRAAVNAQIVIAIVAVLVVCYVAKLLLITIFTSILLAFILEPFVGKLEHWRVPRAAGSFVIVFLLVACLYAGAHFSYNQAIDFVDDLPKYAEKIRATTVGFTRRAAKIEQSTQAVLPDTGAASGVVRIKQETSWSDWLTNSASGITEILLMLSFIPFLTYFMLSWKDRTRQATVNLFDMDNRRAVNQTLGGIASMLRGFLTGNLICGFFLAVASIVVFGFFKIPYFYFLGVLSGFMSLIPYLGVILAVIPPLVASLGQLEGADMLAIIGVVMALHTIAINVLFPKIIGKRLRLNPLVVTLALLIWGWIWGAMGLVLAIPLAGALKIIFDHIDNLRPLGEWMGE